jgi:iron-sulfur cluster repair protein YtfE (RIC family)
MELTCYLPYAINFLKTLIIRYFYRNQQLTHSRKRGRLLMNEMARKITKEMIVNEVTVKYPHTAEIFTKHGLDMCCGGVQSIEKTAAACNVNLEELLDVLNESLSEQISTEEEVKDESTKEPTVAQHEASELKEITGKTTVKEIIKNYPQTKGVFSKYGLLECGGEYGPEEAVYFFARVHNVDGDSLIKELNDVIQGKVAAPEVSAEDMYTAYENIYEKFIKTAIVIALTTGCVYGAVILFYMGIQHSLYAVSKVLIETHGHTQIFGWCGLFIMGVSYFVIPRFYAVKLYSGRLANLSFYFMVAGIFLIFLFRSLLPLLNSPFFKLLIIAGCLLEVLAVIIFLIVAFKTILAAEKQELETYEGFLISGYLWFLVQALVLTGATVHMLKAGETVLPQILIYPLRHIQVMGFITLVIFGVLSRTLPAFLGLKTPNPKMNLLIMLMLNFSVLLRAVSQPLMAYFIDINLPVYYAFNTLFFISGCLEFLFILLFFYNLNILTKPEVDFSGMEIEKSYEKFVWAAILWLIVAEVAMLIFTFYETAAGTPVSHALIGAYRHAVTVGFITIMIFGYASRIIPISQGIKLHSYSLLTKTFILINVGSVIRVVFQPVAVHTGSASYYLIMGISGFIESLAILLFGINIWKTISKGKQGAKDDEVHGEIATVTAATNVYQLIKQHPQAIDILVSKGFTQLKNPILRNTLARAVNVGQAVKINPTDLGQLLKELNEAI